MKLFTNKAPAGLLKASYEQALETGCIQAAPGEQMFAHLMMATNLNPCDGCPEYSSKCRTFAAYHTNAPKKPVAQTRTPALKCERCGLRIRGAGHAEHCKGKGP